MCARVDRSRASSSTRLLAVCHRRRRRFCLVARHRARVRVCGVARRRRATRVGVRPTGFCVVWVNSTQGQITTSTLASRVGFGFGFDFSIFRFFDFSIFRFFARRVASIARGRDTPTRRRARGRGRDGGGDRGRIAAPRGVRRSRRRTSRRRTKRNETNHSLRWVVNPLIGVVGRRGR